MSRHRPGKHHKSALYTTVLISVISFGLLAGLIVGIHNGLIPDAWLDEGYVMTPDNGGALPSGLPSPIEKAQLWGVDVAEYQHPGTPPAPIAWGQVYQSGARFAFVQVSDGTNNNPNYSKDAKAAASARLVVMAYIYAEPQQNPNGADEAMFAVDHMGYGSQQAKAMRLAVDLESSCDKNPQRMVRWIKAFGNEVKQLTGELPIIYTYPNWWDTCTDNSTAFSKYPLWISNFRSSYPPEVPAGLAPTWGFWQWVTGDVDGIVKKPGVDIDVFNPETVMLIDPSSERGEAGAAVRPLQVNSLNRIASDGGMLTFSSAEGLPPGLTIKSDGLITGKPTTDGTYTVTVTATNHYGGSGTATFSWTIVGRVKPNTLPKPSNTPSTSPPASTPPATPTPPDSPLATPTPTGIPFPWPTLPDSSSATPTPTPTLTPTQTPTSSISPTSQPTALPTPGNL